MKKNFKTLAIEFYREAFPCVLTTTADPSSSSSSISCSSPSSSPCEPWSRPGAPETSPSSPPASASSRPTSGDARTPLWSSCSSSGQPHRRTRAELFLLPGAPGSGSSPSLPFWACAGTSSSLTTRAALEIFELEKTNRDASDEGSTNRSQSRKKIFTGFSSKINQSEWLDFVLWLLKLQPNSAPSSANKLLDCDANPGREILVLLIKKNLASAICCDSRVFHQLAVMEQGTRKLNGDSFEVTIEPIFGPHGSFKSIIIQGILATFPASNSDDIQDRHLHSRFSRRELVAARIEPVTFK